MNLFGRYELDSAGLDLCDPTLDLAIPSVLDFGIGLSLQRVQQFLYEARSILRLQGLGASRQFLN